MSRLFKFPRSMVDLGSLVYANQYAETDIVLHMFDGSTFRVQYPDENFRDSAYTRLLAAWQDYTKTGV